MGELWRSESMQLIQLYIQKEAVRDTVDELGNLEMVQFRDLNPDQNAFQRCFVNEIKRLEEMQRKVRFFQDQLRKAAENNVELTPSIRVGGLEENSKISHNVVIDEMESKLEEYEKDLLLMNANQEILDRNYNELIEFKYVLEKDAHFFEEAGSFVEHVAEDQQPLLGSHHAGSLGFITGVIACDKLVAFERVIWRAIRGNVYIRHDGIEEKIKDPQTGEMVDKEVFIIFYQGERAHEKIKRLCDSFGVSLYPCPGTQQARADMKAQVRGRLEDLQSVLKRTQDHSRAVLSRIAENVEKWNIAVLKEKSIYHTMNLFMTDHGRKCLIAEAWCPVNALGDVQHALQRANERSGATVRSIMTVIPTHEQPPTYYRTNKFTESFQAIVDSYGIARYKEVNPAVFTIITFPFLFAVMFGDLGHGFFLALVAGLFIIYENKITPKDLGEMGKTLYDGRYVVFLMGIFAMYVGLIYNETFALPINLFGSSWFYPNGDGTAPNGTDPSQFWYCDLHDPNTACLLKPDSPRYYFGVDPAWKNADNDLIFYNSLKMKLSVILGVTQMVVGIIMSLLNAIHFKKPYNIYFEFIPQMIFMLGLFGYMVFLIFYKWSTPWTSIWYVQGTPDTAPCSLIYDQFVVPQKGNACPNPMILNVMIQMFLSPANFQYPQFGLFPHQGIVQPVLLIVAIASVPIMLFAKPFFLNRDHKKKVASKVYHAVQDEEEKEEEEFEFSEIMVHQVIHTIEFVLGAVSNTASYLRLWALSLAHSELAAVFWNMVMITGLSFFTDPVQKYSFVMYFVCWAIWAALTVGVLLCMESLSAFLHALRLHWVEFQNKFYMGDGYAFVPFSFNRIIAEEAEALALAQPRGGNE